MELESFFASLLAAHMHNLFVYVSRSRTNLIAGIPLTMHLALRYAGIVQVVREKVEKAQFRALLALFISSSCPIEIQRFARLIGNVVDDDEEFERQSAREFHKLVHLQKTADFTAEQDDDDSPTEPVIVLEALAKCTTDNNMQGTNIQGICRCLSDFDVNGDGEIDLEEFRAMLVKAKEQADLFTGSEEPSSLSEKQIQAMLVYDNWPTEHKGPDDVSDGAGMGMLFEKHSVESKEDRFKREVEREKRQVKEIAVDVDVSFYVYYLCASKTQSPHHLTIRLQACLSPRELCMRNSTVSDIVLMFGKSLFRFQSSAERGLLPS